MKKLFNLLLVAMLLCSMLFAGCESKAEKNDENKAVDVESVTDLDAIKNANIVRFTPVADNGLGVRPLMTEEEKAAHKAWLKEYEDRGVFIDYSPDIALYSPEEYLDYIAKNPLYENFIGPENFAPIECLTFVTKPRGNDCYFYTFKINGMKLRVCVDYGRTTPYENSVATKVTASSVGNILLKEASKNKEYEKVQIGEKIEGTYSKGYLTGLTIYTEYATITLSTSYEQSDYVGYGPVLGSILKDGAQAKFGKVMSSLNSWASNFTDVKKIDAAVADANRYAKKRFGSEVK